MQQFQQGPDFNQTQPNSPTNQTLPNLSNIYSYNQNQQFQNNQNYNYQSQPNLFPTSNSQIKPTPKAVTAKKSVFTVKNLLIAVLSVYSIFSFAWIAILYTGIDGNRICINDNVVCKISVPYTKQAATAVNNNIETKNQLVKQKSAKNFIKDIWQNQVILNDTLVTRQQSVEKSIGAFSAYIQNYIRFINEKPEFLKGFTKIELDNKKTDIEQQLANLKLLQDNNYQNKLSYQQQINELYQELGERQDNSFVAQR
jgi:hypothetical protein